jgi:hypothetical protein
VTGGESHIAGGGEAKGPAGRLRYLWVVLFAVAFGFVEASVVVYLRGLYYPGGFAFPLKLMAAPHATTEMVRECATLVMLVAVGRMAGRRGWEKFAYFMIVFGVWDIFYYVWLKLLLGWPSSLLEWDVLFLLPLPWIGPVIAPVLISLVLIVSGVMIIFRISHGRYFRPPVFSWIFATLGTCFLLLSFLLDTGAALEGKIPAPYRYDLLLVGLSSGERTTPFPNSVSSVLTRLCTTRSGM